VHASGIRACDEQTFESVAFQVRNGQRREIGIAGSLGNVCTKTAQGFPEAAYREIVTSLG
jgi:hypothetical protein